MKVLVVEDEQGLAESITDYMVQDGYICETAATFHEAEEKIYLYTYDCVIVDLTLPDGNGFKQLSVQIQASGPFDVQPRLLWPIVW